MNDLDMMSPEKVAAEYGGDKRKIGRAVQMGLLDPTVGVMAGMFIDRMRAAVMKERQPTTTVAQEALAPAGLGAIAPSAPESGIDALPVSESMVPNEYAGGGIVAFARGDLVGQGVNEPFEGESYFDYLLRRTKESLRGPMFSERGPRMGLSEAQYDTLRKAQENEQLFGNILSGKAPTPVRGTDATLMAERTPPGLYADETTRGTAARVAAGGPGRTLAEFGVGAREMADRNAEDERKKIAAAAAARAPAAPKEKEESTEDFLARRKRMLKEAGVSEDPFAKDRESLAELRGKAVSEKEKLDALTMIKAGLGVAGGKSRYALQNLAGAEPALTSYEKGLRQLKEDEKEYAKIDRDLTRAEDALKRGDVDKALEYEDKAKQRNIQLRGVQAQERAASRPSAVNEVLAALQSDDPKVRRAAEMYLGAAKTGQVDERFLMDLWSKMKPIEKLQLQQQGIGYEQWAAKKRAEAAGGGTAAPAGRVIDFGSIK